MTDATPEQLAAAYRDPWQWLHDNGFSWDDVNAIASILAHVYLDIQPENPPLDVERLIRALDASMFPRPGGTSVRDLAKAVAVEYAAAFVRAPLVGVTCDNETSEGPCERWSGHEGECDPHALTAA